MTKVNFKNKAGLNLVASLHETNASTKNAVIIAHGFTSNKDRKRHVKHAETLAESGIAVLRLDFGGCGESGDREITIKAQVDDLKSAIDYLKTDKGYERVGVLGESLGGITTLEAFDNNIDAIVLWAPVTQACWTTKISPEKQADLDRQGYFLHDKDERQFKIPKEYYYERNSIDSEKVLGGITIPVLIVHGTADETIPIEHSEKAIALLPEGSHLERIENLGHGNHKMDADMDKIIPLTVKWFKEHLR